MLIILLYLIISIVSRVNNTPGLSRNEWKHNATEVVADVTEDNTSETERHIESNPTTTASNEISDFTPKVSKSPPGKTRVKRKLNPLNKDYIIEDDYMETRPMWLWRTATNIIEKYPSVAVIYKTNIYHCMGELVTIWFVLTAAHCITFVTPNGFALQQTREYWVRLGSAIYNTGGHIHYIDQFLLHPNYRSDDRYEHYMDLALIRLETKVEISPKIRTVAISDELHSVELQKMVDIGEVCTMPSWSRTKRVLGYYQFYSKMQEVNMTLMPSRACSAIFNGRNSYMRKFNSRIHICGALPGKRRVPPCNADSGAGLFCKNKLVAIVSFAYGCNTPFPTAFARVDIAKEFIQNYTQIRSFVLINHSTPLSLLLNLITLRVFG